MSPGPFRKSKMRKKELQEIEKEKGREYRCIDRTLGAKADFYETNIICMFLNLGINCIEALGLLDFSHVPKA